MEQNRIDDFRKALEEYIASDPTTWVRLEYFFCSLINISAGYKEFTVMVQNAKAWQAGLMLTADEGSMMQWCYNKSKEMGIAHSGQIYRVAVDMEKKKFIDPAYETTSQGTPSQ